MQNKACFSELPNSQELATHQLGLITKPAVARAGSLAQVQLKIYWHGGVGVVEMQNKAKAQPAWLQLAAGAAAWAQLSLAITYQFLITILKLGQLSQCLGHWTTIYYHPRSHLWPSEMQISPAIVDTFFSLGHLIISSLIIFLKAMQTVMNI